MGYYIRVSDVSFKLPKEKFAEALKAIQALHGSESIKDSSGRHFSWVDNEFYKIQSLPEMLEEWRWKPKLDEEGNITNLEFTGQKLGDDELLFSAIASYVDCHDFNIYKYYEKAWGD